MHSQKRSRLAKLSVLILAATPSMCQTTTGSGGSELTFCGGARPIYWSSKDTTETIGQVKEHNAVGKVACGWGRT